MTAERAVRHAIEHNAELTAARHLIAEAQGRARSSGRLANPEVDAELAGASGGRGRVTVGIMQRFPLTARLGLERQLSALGLEAARLEVRERERQLATAVRTAFYELASVQAALALEREQEADAREFAGLVANGVSEGFASALDREQALLNAEALAATAEGLRAEAGALASRLALLLGLPPETPFQTAGALELPAAPPAHRPMGVRADLLLADLAARSGRADLALARASRWEDVGAGLFAEHERLDERPETLVGVRFSVPLPLWQNGRGRVEEKAAALERRQAEARAAGLAVENEVAASHRLLVLRHAAAGQSAGKLVPAAKRQLGEAFATYRRGELEIVNVFRARERLTELERAALEARKSYFLAYTQWLAALGEPQRN